MGACTSCGGEVLSGFFHGCPVGRPSAPQAESANVRDCQRRKLHEGPCQPDPDAAVRTIAELWGQPFTPGGHENDKLRRRVNGAVREAFAAGRALGRDEGAREEQEACWEIAATGERLGSGMTLMKSQQQIADAIARRGSEWK